MILEAFKKTLYFSIFLLPIVGFYFFVILIENDTWQDFTETIDNFGNKYPYIAIGWHLFSIASLIIFFLVLAVT